MAQLKASAVVSVSARDKLQETYSVDRVSTSHIVTA